MNRNAFYCYRTFALDFAAVSSGISPKYITEISKLMAVIEKIQRFALRFKHQLLDIGTITYYIIFLFYNTLSTDYTTRSQNGIVPFINGTTLM